MPTRPGQHRPPGPALTLGHQLLHAHTLRLHDNRQGPSTGQLASQASHRHQDGRKPKERRLRAKETSPHRPFERNDRQSKKRYNGLDGGV